MRTMNKKRAVLITEMNKKPETEEEKEERELMEVFTDDIYFEVNKMASKLLLGFVD